PIMSILREIETASEYGNETRIHTNSLAAGVIKHLNTIDFLIARGLGARKPSQLNARERSRLRLAVFECRWFGIALETLSDEYLKQDPRMETVVKKAIEVDVERATQRLSTASKLSVQYSHPSFMVETLLDNLPEVDVLELLKANNGGRHYYIRANKFKEGHEILPSIASELGAIIEPDVDIQGLYRVTKNIDKLVGSKPFQDGSILIHDKASVLTVHALDLKSGDVVWDSCAAPGQKTQLIAEQVVPSGRVVASERYADRLRIAKERTNLLESANVEWLHADASKSPVRNVRKILIDAPCSSTGTLNSHPYYKWRLNKQTLLGIMSVQNKILDGIIGRFSDSPGTEIVYATCSVLPHEGESQIDSVLNRHEIELLDLGIPGSIGYPGFECSKSVRRLFPHKHATSGFFIARFRITD
ncbi:MAG: RsmB/NOP family class I SAM-dependent RNA methyltransferase, partial [Candidatus Thorarchaeota archaeon]|nr:RsmB/NOP family class I SAM-dependent RNA methyltransferase [Candidatus Thorarchaeota archaeon]